SEDAGTQGAVEIAVLHAADEIIGLQVDQCVGSQDVVIKSLAENLTYLPGLAGASILGDGTVALMLDVAALPRLLLRHSLVGLEQEGNERSP
ncbi:MAG: chemotaxis protein CheW, partial [Planctomycetota bacterium]